MPSGHRLETESSEEAFSTSSRSTTRRSFVSAAMYRSARGVSLEEPDEDEVIVQVPAGGRDVVSRDGGAEVVEDLIPRRALPEPGQRMPGL